MGRKRANAEGSIYFNETRRRWEAALVVGWVDGRPKRRTFTGPTRKAVTVKLDAAKQALDQGLGIPDARTTIADYATWWEREVLPGAGLAPKTEAFYRDQLAYYVVPAVGHRTLAGPRAVTVGDVETMTGRLLAAGHSTRTATAARTTLSKLLHSAQQRGLVARNVARLANPPRSRGKARPVKALTVAEVAALLGAISGSRWEPPVIVAVTTGLRPQELLALHWPDIHLDGGDPHLSVRHAISHVGGPQLKAPKRDRSYRTVPLVPEAVDALRAWKKEQAAERLKAGPLWSQDWPGLVFTGEAGGPVRVDTFRQALGRAVPGVHPHRLRHSFATHLLEAGTPIHHVAELLGDAAATVEAAYSHVLRRKTETVAVTRGLLSRGS